MDQIERVDDGHENDRPSKLQGMKLQDIKMTDQVAGMKLQDMKMTDMKLQDVKLTDMKLQDMKMMDQVAGHEILRRHLFLRFVASLEILP